MAIDEAEGAVVDEEADDDCSLITYMSAIPLIYLPRRTEERPADLVAMKSS